MQIIVHAGLPKTGSSAIQAYLADVRTALGDLDFFYPDLGTVSHWNFAAALKSSTRPGGARGYLARRANKKSLAPKEAHEAVAAVIRSASPAATVILSHENFSADGQGEQLKQFLNSVAPDARVFVIGYARAPVQLYMSGLQHSLKRLKGFPLPREWESSHPSRVAALRSVFGNATTIAVHDRAVLAHGDVVEDFRCHVERISGRALPPAPKSVTSNSSFSAPVCALLYRHQQSSSKSDRARHVELRVNLAQFSIGRENKKISLPEAWSAVVAKRNRKAWNDTVREMAYDEQTKTRLYLKSPRQKALRVRQQEFSAWLDSYFDPEFTIEFAEYLAKETGSDNPANRELRSWLKQQIATTD